MRYVKALKDLRGKPLNNNVGESNYYMILECNKRYWIPDNLFRLWYSCKAVALVPPPDGTPKYMVKSHNK